MCVVYEVYAVVQAFSLREKVAEGRMRERNLQGMEGPGVFEWLNNALFCRDVHLIYLPVDPKRDSFRQEEPFHDIIRAMRL